MSHRYGLNGVQKMSGNCLLNRLRQLAAAAGIALAVAPASAEISLSGFGTAGYAVSNQSYDYQRFINDRGTLKRDSVIGLQLDAKLGDGFGLTLQGKLAPSLESDSKITPTVSWAFLSWRPNNDWLVRAGKVRAAAYLNNENQDVGATFEFARLPVEVYSTSQVNDGDGISIDKTWNIGDGELTAQAFWGSTKTHYRWYRRDPMPVASLPAGEYFVPVKLDAALLALTWLREENIFRISLADSTVKILDSQLSPVTFPYVASGGYYQTSNQLPGPGVQMARTIHASALVLGMDVALGGGVRMMSELVRRQVRTIETGPDSMAGYVALLKPIAAWTPYVSVARIESTPRTRDLYNKLNRNTGSSSPLLNATQRAGADGVMAFDQTTWAIGTSYRLTPTSKLKTEWARTRTGDMSYFIDAPPGGESGKQTVDVFSFSCNVVF